MSRSQSSGTAEGSASSPPLGGQKATNLTARHPRQAGSGETHPQPPQPRSPHPTFIMQQYKVFARWMFRY